MKKRTLIALFLLMIIFCSLFVFASCEKGNDEKEERDYSKEPLTEEEIKTYVEKTYFDEDGKAKNELWNNAYYTFYYGAHKRKYEYKDIEIKDFSVQFIKDAYGNNEWYLVEFEPSGHRIGKIHSPIEKTAENFFDVKYFFYDYPSPFKILQVEENNRYFQDGRYGMKENGYLIDITEEALKDYLDIENAFMMPIGLKTFDYEANEWIRGKRNYALHPMTENEIEDWVQATFYDDSGNIRANLWEESEENDPFKDRYINHYDGKDVTGYKISFLNTIRDQDKGVYLVEFEPYGYFIGNIYSMPSVNNTYFKSYPSPFALLNINDENRYMYSNRYVAIRDGKYTDIPEEATIGTIYIPYQNYQPQKITYDEEKKIWITEVIEEKQE